MTACLYTRPKGLPLILTDTVITRPTDDLKQLVLPGSLVRHEEGELVSSEIARKIYIFNDFFVIACAGELRCIENFLDEVENITSRNRNLGALEEIYEILQNYENRLEAFVCFENGEEAGLVGPGETGTEMSDSVDIRCCGSGGTALWAHAIDDIYRFDYARWKDLSGYDIISNIAGRAISRMIGNELLYGHAQDWGGFGEWAFFDCQAKTWRYSPTVLYGFVLGVPLPGQRFTLEVSSYWYCYDNLGGGETSASLGIRLTDEAFVQQWVLEDIRSADPVSGRTYSEWTGWQPEEVVMQIFPYGAVEPGSLFVVSNKFEDLHFEINEGSIGAGVRQGLLNDWGRSAAETWGLEYVPATKLDDDQRGAAYLAAKAGGWGF